MQLTGIHHLTAITAHAVANKAFYTQTLGLRLVKKTVNQDDTSSYHLFYADGDASPGTDITFFDWPATPERRGTHSIVRTAFRVAEASLPYWQDRLVSAGVRVGEPSLQDGRQTLEFEDAEGQRLALVAADNDGATPRPWEKSPVPAEHQIRGLGPITISVPALAPTAGVLTDVLNMTASRTYTRPSSDGNDTAVTVHVFSMGSGGPAAELHVAVEPHLGLARQGGGAVHHVAFRVPTFDDYDAWNRRLQQLGVRSSGPVDRFYFKSLYFREPNGILFELATDGPGFAADEPIETLGQKLALPPFLEGRRAAIEARLKPL